MQRYAIYGAAGFGREVLPLLRAQCVARGDVAQYVLVDDDPERETNSLNGSPCISFEALIQGDIESTRVCVSISDSRVRERLVQKCESAGLQFVDVVASTHNRYVDVMIKEGVIACANTMITSNVTIGRHMHLNIYSYIAHDCVIGDYVTIAPRVSCNGNILIEDHAYIGTGAVLKQGTPDKPIRIGRGAVVGMGAVVTRDVADGSVVVGNPARPLSSGSR